MTTDLQRLRRLAARLEDLGAVDNADLVSAAVREIEVLRADPSNATAAADDALAVFRRDVSGLVPEDYAVGYTEACEHIAERGRPPA